MDLLFHMDTIRTLCLFAMDASTEGLVVTHGHYCYVICTRLLWWKQSKLLIKCVIYLYMMPEEQIPGVTFHLICIYVSICVYYVLVW